MSKKYEPLLVWRRRQTSHKLFYKPSYWAKPTWRDILAHWIDHKLNTKFYINDNFIEWYTVGFTFGFDFEQATNDALKAMRKERQDVEPLT
ncbi:MAG: hypothetical protein ACXABY_06455 [Candidatus Thorarchaeota archaeon]